MEPNNKIKVQRMLIGPAQAKEMLETNHEYNRTINKFRVENYAKDMIAGAWSDNGETIKIDRAGKLIDGQHRLKAIIKANTYIWMWVAQGLDDNAFKTVDVGMPRTARQLLKMSGTTDPIKRKFTITSAVNLLFKAFKLEHRPTQHQLEKCIEVNHETFEWAYNTISIANDISALYIVAAMFMHINGVPDNEITGWITGANRSVFDEHKSPKAYKFCIHAENFRKSNGVGWNMDKLQTMLRYAYSYEKCLDRLTQKETVYDCSMGDDYKLVKA